VGASHRFRGAAFAANAEPGLLHELYFGQRCGRQSRPKFTERERQVLSFVFEGLANKQIADRLEISESAVKASLQQLFAKTGVRT
jgi:DNA-binding NarL/FixJ family response regulator